jgi:hypothetical protein
VAQRRHHYERAFERYLRRHRIPYVSIDEAKKALLPERARFASTHPDEDESKTLKSFDFVVYAPDSNFLVEVKGRKVSRSLRDSSRSRSRLESWVTQDDVDSLRVWQSLFGEGFAAVIVFLYWCQEEPPDALFQETFTHNHRWYALRAITVDDYASSMRVRSPRWRTVHLPADEFERLSHPFSGP